MEKSRRFGIVLLWVAGGFVLIALITWVRAGGDLSADIEFRVPRRRRSTGEAWTYTAPAFPLFTELLMFAAAIALSGIAHIRGSLRILVVSAVVGVAAAIWLVTAQVLFVRESRTLMGAILFALVTIGLALYAPIAEVRDGRRSRAAARGDHSLPTQFSGTIHPHGGEVRPRRPETTQRRLRTRNRR